MKLFNFLQENPRDQHLISASEQEGLENHNGQAKDVKEAPVEIPEDVFVEYEKPSKKLSSENNERPEVNNLKFLYDFLERNLEKKGYEDALVNPDTSYMEENILHIRNELSLVISKTRIYYLRYLRTIDFHLDTRKKNGMVETVEELIAYRENVEQEFEIVSSIEADATKGIGLSQNPILGYKKGFRNGFAAITYNTILANRD